MNCYKVNLDYESFLFDPSYKEQSPKFLSMIKEFEYIFFLINKENCILKNHLEYEETYLNSLRALGFVIPQFNPAAQKCLNWWGQQKNIELERQLNSKLTSAAIALENNWGMFDGAIVQSNLDAKNWVSSFPNRQWLIKNPHGVSGSGHALYTDKNFSGAHLLEPVFQRVFDIGTTFEVVDGQLINMFMVENINSKVGSFKGGVGAKNIKLFKSYIFNKYNFDLSELENITKKIFRIYLELGATSNIQIDSFVYLDGGILKLYPLVEVNYRKTMGLVLQSLVDQTNANIVEWKVTHTNELELKAEWKKLSPGGNRFKSYFRIG